MPKFDSPLNNVRIASPCSADWNEMYGDDRKRFCGDCKLNVFNLSNMTRDEAEALIMNAEQRLCIRFYQRADGSVITKDCPVGWARIKQRTKVMATAVMSLVMAIFSGVFLVTLFSPQKDIVGRLKMPLVNPAPMGVMMGNVAVQTNNNKTPVDRPDSNMTMGEMMPADRPVRQIKPAKRLY